MPTEPTIFRPSVRYTVLAVLGLAMAGLLAWDLRTGFAWDIVFFCALGVIGGLWSLWMASSRIEVSESGILLRRAGSTAQQVDFRQVLSAGEVGHLTRLIVITYSPRQANGLLDPESVATLALPSVTNQAELSALIGEKIPS
jgi:hypothetical protein